MSEPTHPVSVETIAHYRCGECGHWWFVSNSHLPIAAYITCPNCAHIGEVVVLGPDGSFSFHALEAGDG